MDLPRLRAFVAVSDLRHFGRAAERLHVTQPALTKRIQALESTLGGPLFERDREGVRLTPFGAFLLPDARRITAEADALLTRARGASQGKYGRIDIGFGLSCIDLAPRLISLFRAAHPDVILTLDDYSSAEQIDRLMTGSLDLGFLRLPTPSALTTMPLIEDRLAVAVPGDWADPFDFSDMERLNRKGFVMLTRDRGPGLAGQIAQWCSAIGFVPRIVQQAEDIQTVLALVAAGVGVSIVPFGSGRLMRGSVRLERMLEQTASWAIGMAWRSDRESAALRNFIALAEMETLHLRPER